MKLRVEYTYDRESRNWAFCVPTLGIVGSAATRELPEGEAVAAIRFTLEADKGGPAAKVSGS